MSTSDETAPGRGRGTPAFRAGLAPDASPAFAARDGIRVVKSPGTRRPLAAVAAAVLLACVPSTLAGCSPGPEALHPGIVLVVWDTCRADRAEVNGYGRPTTPRLARLAANGTTFRNCIAPSPWTAPSHASLFTGVLPRRHGLREGVGDRVRSGFPLLATTLRSAGYETVAFTANPHISQATGLDEGFESVFPCYDPDTGTWPATRVAGRVREWMDARRAGGGARRPLFLFVNLMDTHLPLAFDAEAVAAAAGRGSVEGARAAAAAVPERAALAHLYGVLHLEDRTIRALGDAYDGAVRTDDAATGSILDALRLDGLLENALVAVTADHGENFGEHGEMSHLLSLHEPVLRVPLVVSWPGRFEAGRVESSQVRLQDLYPTILEAARVPVPAPCGADAASLIGGPLLPRVAVSEYGPPLQHLGEVAAEFPGQPESRWERFHHSLVAVREEAPGGGAMKYIATRRHDPDAGVDVLVGEELFDLSSDPGEERDLLGTTPRPGARSTADRLRALGEDGPPPPR